MKIKKLWRSFRYAFHGIQEALEQEQTFKIQLFVSGLVLLGIFLFPLTIFEKMLVLILIFFVLALELFNTAIERIIDYFKPEVHPQAQFIKDVSAAAVFVASLCAFIVGVMIFVPYLLALLK